jgi:hypothetical protein
MDPNTTIILAIDAAQDGDAIDACMHLCNLLRWLDKGGFKPARLSERCDSIERALDASVTP